MLNTMRSQDKLMAFNRDGVFDIVLGLGLIAAGAYLYFDLIALGGIIVVLAIPLVQGLKRAITAPRLTSEDAPLADEVRVWRGLMIGALLLGVLFLGGVAVYGLGRSDSLPAWLSDAIPLLILVATGAFLVTGAYVTRSWRMVGYGVLIVAAYGAMRWLSVELWLGLVGLGVAMVVIGIVFAVRFMTTHPVLPPEQQLHFR